MCKKANRDVGHLQVYEPRRQQRHLDSQKYTWNTPASTDSEPRERLAKSPPLALSLSRLRSSARPFYAHNCGRKYETGSQYKDRSLESNSRVTECHIRCFLVGGTIQKRLLRCPKSRQKSVPNVERNQFDLSKKAPRCKNILRVLRTFSLFMVEKSHNPTPAAPEITSSQLRPYLRGISTPCMGHFILPSAADEKVKAVDNNTPFHQKQVGKSGG